MAYVFSRHQINGLETNWVNLDSKTDFFLYKNDQCDFIFDTPDLIPFLYNTTPIFKGKN